MMESAEPDEEVPEILGAIAQRHRLEILRLLAVHEIGLGPTAIVNLLGKHAKVSPPLVVKHLRILEKVGLVKRYNPRSPSGKTVWAVVGAERIQLILDTIVKVRDLVRSGAAYKQVEGMMMMLALLEDREKVNLKSRLRNLSSNGIRKNLTERERKNAQAWAKLLELLQTN